MIAMSWTRPPPRVLLCALILAAGPAVAAAQLHLGLEAGLHGDTGGVEGYQRTRFERTTTYSPSLGYRFGFGLDLELAVRRLAPRLTEDGVDFGVLDMAVILFRVGYRALPRTTGPGFHAGMGFGYAVSDFQNGPFIAGLERQIGGRIDFMTEGMSSFAFDVDAGLDYLVLPWLAFTANLRGAIIRQDFRVFASGKVVPLQLNDSTFVLLGGDVTVGVRLWLWR